MVNWAVLLLLTYVTIHKKKKRERERGKEIVFIDKGSQSTASLVLFVL